MMSPARRTLLLGLAALPMRVRAGALAIVDARRVLQFPRDFGAHPDSRTEWWYATGWLGDEGDQASTPRFGFQVTFFRSRTAIDASHPSRFAARQLLFAHAALSDLRAGTLLHDQRIARGGFQIAAADETDTRLRLRGWSLERHGPATQSRYHARVASELAGFAFELQLQTTQAPLLQGDAGYSRKGAQAGAASHYYSQPQLAVSGTVTREGRARPLLGRAWLDHEWSETLMDAEAVGWDWIGINLADGSALTAFRLRRADGSAVYAGGSLRRAGESARSFAPAEVSFTPGRRWVSPATNANYPVKWTVRTPAGTHTVQALLDAQELDSRASTGAVYWEGLSELRDEGGRRVGLGYLEMTGYAARLRL